MDFPNLKKKRLSLLVSHGLVISGRGGGKSGGSARTPVEANDTVNSRAMASVLDLLGEGVIGGLVDGAKSIFLNDTPLQNNDGSFNFSGVTWWFRDGAQDQAVIDGFDFIETPKSVGRQLKQASQVNVSLDSAGSDRIRVVMKFPSLRNINKENGDTSAITVKYKFQIDAGNGKGFVDVIAEGEKEPTITLTAKKTGVYYRSYIINLPKPAKTYTLRAIRLTEDHKDNSYLYDDTYIDSIGEIVNTSLNYPNSVLAGLKINSEQFGSSMPSRSYLIKGLKIRVPSNYNTNTNTYNGNWDGTFQLISSSNPAWILFDLLTNTRYGLGEFVKESMINIGELYQIGRYCDTMIDDGFGGKEKRFSINTQLTSRQDAYRVVQDIAGAFRGMIYWAGGMVHITQDSPADPVMLFSNSNVVNGSFAYKGSARKDRYSVALITYNNKEDGYKQSVEYVEDQESIKRYGIRKTESVAFGCTSRGQAHRVGLWLLYTSRMESDVITFSVGMDSVFLMPGDIVLIADKFRSGRRNSGRVTGFTGNSIKLDAPVDLTSVGNHITFMSAEGKVVERDILENGNNVTTVTFKNTLVESEKPVSDAVWVIAQPDLSPLQARVVGVSEGTDGTSFNITAIQNNPTKYEAVDSGVELIPQNTTVLDPTYSRPSNITITEGTYLSSPGNLSVSLTVAWEGKSSQYYISWRRSDTDNVSNWKFERVTEEQFELRDVAENGQYDFQVYAVSVSGRKTDTVNTTYKVLGTLSAPAEPTSLTAAGDYRSIVLNWANPSSVDLDYIEVLASKTNDKTKAQVIAKVTGTTFSHNGLEDSITWYYWVRAVNKRGMLSALNSPLATIATTRDVLSFLKNKITESELGSGLISDIDSKAVSKDVDAAIKTAKDQATAAVGAAQKSLSESIDSTNKTLSNAINKEVSDRINAITNEANERTQTITAETNNRAKAISAEATNRAAAISDSLAVEVSNRAKAIADTATSLSSKIDKEVKDRAAAVSALDTKTVNAISAEYTGRIAAIEGEAKARADALLQEKNSRQSEISTLKTQVQTANSSLAQQISQVAAGTGEQFDSLNIWYFDSNNEGWLGNGSPTVTTDGWLRQANHATDPYIISPSGLSIRSESYRFIKLRLKKVGSPSWGGQIRWATIGKNFDDKQMVAIPEPVYDDSGIATLTAHDILWNNAGVIDRFRLDLTNKQDDKNYILVDWIAVGRPTPGAGMSALQEEKTARVNADAAEADNRYMLAVQIRGSYDGNDLSKVGSGLIFQEQQARVTADKAEASSRQSLETKFNDSVSSINKLLDTLNEKDRAIASDITGIKSSLSGKAEASALQTLQTSVTQQGSNISTQGQSITKLQNDLNTANTNIGKKADQTALTSLQGTVTQQGKDISASNSSITNLQSSLNDTDKNVAKKADSSALNDLTSRVVSAEGRASSQADSIVSLKNSLSGLSVGGRNLIKKSGDMTGWGKKTTETYRGNAVAKVTSKAGSSYVDLQSIPISAPVDGTEYVYSFYAKADTSGQTINVFFYSPNTTKRAESSQGVVSGSVDGRIAFTLTTEWTWYSVKWTQNATSGTKSLILARLEALSEKDQSVYLSSPKMEAGNVATDWTPAPEDLSSVDDMSALKISLDSTSNALQSVTSRVQSAEGAITSQGNSITSLQNSLTTTNANLGKKADASALSTLDNKVTQQGKDIVSSGSEITSLKNSLVATNSNVDKKADASALNVLDSKVTAQGDVITSQGSDLTNLSNTLSEIRGDTTNLLINSGFERGLAEWHTSGKGITVVESDNSGKAAQFTVINSQMRQNVNLRKGRTYVMSARVKLSKDFSVPSGWGNTKIRLGKSTGELIRDANFSAALGKDAWITVSLTQTMIEDQICSAAIISGQSAGICWVDDVVLEDVTEVQKTSANADALTALDNKVTQQGNTVSSQSSNITKLQNDLASTNADVSKKADSTALSALDSKVTQQGKDITSQGSAVTKLQNDLMTANGNISKKAESTALQALQNTVTQQGNSLTSQSGSITSLASSLGVRTVFSLYSKGYVATESPRESGIYDDSGKSLFRAARSYGLVVFKKNTDGSTGVLSGKTYDLNGNAAAGAALSDDIAALTNGTFVAIICQDEPNSRKELVISAIESIGGTKEMMGAIKSRSGYILLGMKGLNPGEGLELVSKTNAVADSYVTTSVQFIDGIMMGLGAAGGAMISSGVNASAISTLDTKVTQQGDTVSSQGSSITKLQNDLSTANINIGKKAEATALSALDTKVTQQGTTLISQGSSITNLQNSLATTNTNVGKKADSTALTALDNKVTQQGDALTAQGNSVTSLSNTLSEMRGDSTNLILNGGFERGFSEWNAPAGLVIVDSDNDGKALQFGVSRSTVSQTITLRKGRTYRFSAMVKLSSDFTVSDWGNTKLRLGESNGKHLQEINFSSALNKNAWVAVSFERVITTDGKYTVSVNSYQSVGLSWVDDVAVEDVTDSKAISVNAATISSLDSKVTQQGNNLTSQSSSITKLQNDLNTTNSNVGKKADATALSALDTKVTQQGNNISTQASSITQLEGKLTAIDIGGTNLLLNSSFKEDTVKWSVNGVASAASIVVDTTIPNKFGKCLRLVAVQANNGMYQKGQFAGVAGDMFTLSFWAKAGEHGLQMNVMTENVAGKSVTLTTEWVKYVVTGRKSNSNDFSTVMYPRSAGTFWISAVKLEKGTYPTDWSPAPLDVDGADQANASAITALDTKMVQQGNTLTSQGSSITKLQNDLGAINTEVGKKAESSALQSLQNTVKQQGDTLTSQGSSITSLNSSTSSIDKTLTDVEMMARLTTNGKQLIADPNFSTRASSGVGAYNNTNNGNVLFSVVAKQATNPTTSGYEGEITVKGSASPNFGGFVRSISSRSNALFVSKYIIKLPVGWSLQANANATGDGRIDKFVGNIEGTGKFETYYRITKCGATGSFSTFGHVSAFISDSSKAKAPTIAEPMVWSLAQIEVYDTTDYASATSDVTKFIASATSSLDTLTSLVQSQSSQIISLQSGLSEANTNVSKKADQTALQSLQTTVTNQGNNITAAANRVTALEGSMTIGDNLVPNSAMLNNAQGWGGDSTTIDGYNGVKSSGAYRPFSPKFAVTAGDIIDFSLMCMAATSTTGLSWGIRFDGPSLNNVGRYTTALNYAAGEKKIVTGSFTVPAGATSGILQPGNGTTVELTIYNVDVTRRNTGTVVNSNAISTLNTTTQKQGDSITSQGTAITNLQNGLNTANTNIGKKADATALQTLQNTVTSQGNTLTAANASITSLSSKIEQVQSDLTDLTDLIDVDLDLSALDESIYYPVTLGLNINNRYYFKIFRTLRLFPGNNPSYATHSTKTFSTILEWEVSGSGWGTQSVNRNIINFDYRWMTQSAIMAPRQLENSSTEYVYLRGGSIYRLTKHKNVGHTIRTSKLTANDQSVEPIAYDVSRVPVSSDNATSTAISDLSTKLTSVDGKVTAQSTQLTNLQSQVGGVSSSVDRLAKTVSTNQSTQATVNSSVTAQFSTQTTKNNQTTNDLKTANDNIASIKTTQTSQATQISNMSKLQTDMTASLNNQSASIQTLQQTVATKDNLDSTWMVNMEVRSDGKKYASGIALGIDGKSLQSQFLIQADRLALINSSTGTVTTPFVIDSGVTYIAAAVIKDGSITNAKVGDLQSTNYVNGKSGWRIPKSGNAELNDVIVRGTIYATDGRFEGTVYASKIEGDVVKVVQIPLRGSVVIEPVSFNRILAIPTVSIIARDYRVGSGDNQSTNVGSGTCTLSTADGEFFRMRSAGEYCAVGSAILNIPANKKVTVSYWAELNYATATSQLIGIMSKV